MNEFKRKESRDIDYTTIILECYNKLNNSRILFTTTEEEIIKLFKISTVFDSKFWSSLISGEEKVDVKVFHNTFSSLIMLREYLPTIVRLFERETDRKEIKLKFDGKLINAKIIRVFVNEKGNRLTPNNLIIKILRSIDDLYTACAKFQNVNEATLSLGSIDSGSEKSFDFIGVSSVIDSVKAIIGDVWDRIKYSKEDGFDRKLKIAIKAMKVLELINTSENKKGLSKEESEKMKRQIVKSVELLLKSGAYTEEMEIINEVKASEIIYAQKELIEYNPANQSEENSKTFSDQSFIVSDEDDIDVEE